MLHIPNIARTKINKMCVILLILNFRHVDILVQYEMAWKEPEYFEPTLQK